jgi:hypothetical protein
MIPLWQYYGIYCEGSPPCINPFWSNSGFFTFSGRKPSLRTAVGSLLWGSGSVKFERQPGNGQSEVIAAPFRNVVDTQPLHFDGAALAPILLKSPSRPKSHG